MKIITENRQANFEYFIEERYPCGIVLEGAEVKSVRLGNVNLKDSFCSYYNGEIFIKGMHIALYKTASAFNNKDSKRDRKLLLRRAEINRIVGKVNEKGMTLVPLKVYFEGNLVKVEIGLCRGKHTYDKKQSIKERDINRETNRQLASYK